ncbi:hypothetical protein E3T23_06550 [Cryobacterium cheniae]|uniref:Uncharacterized protein n=1 Tax=Cryobacterium cheniae TaxID=1259262 RepID=A0A4R8XSL7_9MICO|nr:hypothetical protein [Cryobacterium cheniae]TFC81152.1 hypothetical protein E3T23_06550 [Cryobacterium cheniae]
MREIGDWPQLGNVHKDGGRYIGHEDGSVDAFNRAGTPTVNKLLQSSVTERVGGVRLDDELAVSFDGTHWWAATEAGSVGRLTWSLAIEIKKPWNDFAIVLPRRGTLTVRRLLLDRNGEVINCGGIVRPF